MDQSYFKSRQFGIAAVVASAILVGGAIAVDNGFFGGERYHSSCGRPRAVADAINLTRTEETLAEGAIRVIHYALPANLSGGQISLCTSTGDIQIRPATDGSPHLEVTIEGSGRDAAVGAAETQVTVRAAMQGGRFSLNAAETLNRVGGGLFDRDSTKTSFYLYLPTNGSYDLRTDTATGDTILTGLLVGNVTAESATGNIFADDLDAQGNLTFDSSTGDLELRLSSVQSGNITLDTSTGDIVTILPARVDVGYSIYADTSTGDVTDEVGETDYREHDRDAAGDTFRGQTRNFVDKPTKVYVKADSSTGDIKITIR